MAWLRKGDNSATHPLVMALATVRGADDRLLNEAYGFVQRCAEQSAGHMTDGVIDLGTAQLMGGHTRYRALLKACVEAGLLTQRGTGKDAVWLVPDDADFIHIRKRAEIEWERQRARDNSNPDLTVPVRLRDGDGCRYCHRIVNWKQRRGRRGGTYDHRVPGQAATIDTLVVACLGCNSTRLDDPNADDKLPLLPAPADPYYGPETVAFLANHGETVQQSPARPGTQPGTAAPSRPGTQPDPASTATTPTPGHRAPDEAERPGATDTAADPAATRPPGHRTPWARPGYQSDTAAPPFATRDAGPRAPTEAERPGIADTASLDEGHETVSPAGSARSSQIRGLGPGSGRDGSGRAGTGGDGTGARPRKRRARRGRPA